MRLIYADSLSTHQSGVTFNKDTLRVPA